MDRMDRPLWLTQAADLSGQFRICGIGGWHGGCER